MPKTSEDFVLFIPSYHRPGRVKTAYYFERIIKPENIHVFIDSEADDAEQYICDAKAHGYRLVQFDIDQSRERYDNVHRASVSRRSAGQARNMFHDFARQNGISEYVVIDDDTTCYQIRPFAFYYRLADAQIVRMVFSGILQMMRKWHIGMFGLAQTGDFIGGELVAKSWQQKVMNTTFINTEYIYRGERGVQDDDTSQFVGVWNNGLFSGSLKTGLVLNQIQSATQAGGLTDLYNECKLLNKSLITPIQFPSAICAEKQVKNGGRLHHHIKWRYMAPKIIKGDGRRTNIPWDTYAEDYPFTNEPKRGKKKESEFKILA